MMQEIFLKDYQVSAFSIESVYLTIQLDAEKTIVTNNLKIKRQHPQEDLFLHGNV